MKSFFVSIILFVFAAGCSEETNQPIDNVAIREVYGIRIKEASTNNKTISLTVDCEVPDPCWLFSHFESVTNGNTIQVTVYTKSKPEAACAAVLSSFQTTLNIDVKEPGSYTIHYRENYDTMKDSTFVVN